MIYSGQYGAVEYGGILVTLRRRSPFKGQGLVLSTGNRKVPMKNKGNRVVVKSGRKKVVVKSVI
jgi:hypothetical protein